MQNAPINDFHFERFLAEEQLMGSKCSECGKLYAPPRGICTNCRGTELKWVPLKGTGKLAAFTIIHVAPPAMVSQGYDRDHPYCTGVVELDEKERVVARIEGIDPGKPEEIEIGMVMEATFLHSMEGDARRTWLAFKPARGRK